MKKQIAVILAGLVVAGGGYGWDYSQHRHPTTTCTDAGCSFVYNLCVPSPPPLACASHTFTLNETYGEDANFMPYNKRDHNFTTKDELKSEAEARANLIENIHK